MGPPVAQLRPRNSGRDFFWRIILCARVYALGLMDRVRFRGADYSLCNTFCIKSAGSKPATQAPQITPKSFGKGFVHRYPLFIEYKTDNIYCFRILFMGDKIVITPRQCLGAFYEI